MLGEAPAKSTSADDRKMIEQMNCNPFIHIVRSFPIRCCCGGYVTCLQPIVNEKRRIER
jgi:hypothetical protein